MHVIKDDTPTLRPIARLASGRRCSYDKLGTSYFGAPRHAPQAHPRTVSVQIEIPFPSQIARARAWRLSAKRRRYATSRRCCASTAEAAFSMHSRVTDRSIMTGKRLLNWETVEDARRLK